MVNDKPVNRTDPGVQSHSGGSFRDRSQLKGLFAAQPANAVIRVAERYAYGKWKYGKSDAYKDGLPCSDCIDSVLRHIWEYMDGDNKEDHLAAAVWGLQAVMYYEECKPEWQDIESRKKFKGRAFHYLRRLESSEDRA